MDSKEATGTVRKPGPKPLQSSSPRTQYLILYNFVSMILWLVVLGRVILLVPLAGFGNVYGGVGNFAKWTQTLALLEVVHSAVGLVRAPIGTTLMQVSSRLLLVWGIVNNFPFVAKSSGYSSMLFAWGVTEVVRYGFFVFTLSGYSPDIITWLRYNQFLILYPLGASSEAFLVYKSIPAAKKIRQEFAWILQLILFIYIPGFYVLFSHMLKQRTKIMRGKQVRKAK